MAHFVRLLNNCFRTGTRTCQRDFKFFDIGDLSRRCIQYLANGRWPAAVLQRWVDYVGALFTHLSPKMLK